ncbi:MAG: hypothetical protein ACJATX_000286 [Candidatus Paceibacteria bacterium]|jgi:hypothetical protein
MFILVAVKKFRMGYGGFAESLVNGDTLFAKELPDFLLYAYGYVIPALEFIIGAMLLLNKKTKLAYQIMAGIYLSFIIGQQYDGNTSKVGNEYLPALLTLVVAYYTYHKAGVKK